MKGYLDVLREVYEEGTISEDRTGVGTKSLFGKTMRFDLTKGFPAVTTKKLAFKSVKSELLWFIEGSTDERRLAEIHYGKPREELEDCRTIWTDNAESYFNSNSCVEKRGELGNVYGYQWQAQLGRIIKQIEENPTSRRHLVDSWNPADLRYMALPPCHYSYQFYSRNGYLSCKVDMRSGDMFLGVPFNIASYALLTHMVASVTGLEVFELIINIGDAHIYLNHINQVEEQLSREPLPLPKLWLDENIKDIRNFTLDSMKLLCYNHHPAIKGDMAI